MSKKQVYIQLIVGSRYMVRGKLFMVDQPVLVDASEAKDLRRLRRNNVRMFEELSDEDAAEILGTTPMESAEEPEGGEEVETDTTETEESENGGDTDNDGSGTASESDTAKAAKPAKKPVTKKKAAAKKTTAKKKAATDKKVVKKVRRKRKPVQKSSDVEV